MKSDKNVLIIYTGGTIGMKKTELGYSPAKGYFRGALLEIDDINHPDFPSWELIELEPLLDSSNMSYLEWNRIGEIIYKNYNEYDGFVVLHGTDTMAYTASALSFMLEGLDKPVILTGSQIPLSELRSDGRENLITSVLIAAEGRVREIALAFGGKLLRGNRATKMSADGLIAFDSPNYPHLADVGITVRYNETALSSSTPTDLSFTPFSPVPIGVLKVFPGIQLGLFEEVLCDKLSGIVLETFGAGNIPNSSGELLPIIRKAFEKGTVVTVISQCPAGTVSLGTYETSTGLAAAGAVSGFDMTTEAAVAKLYYLFSKGVTKDEIKASMEANLRGELSR